MTYLDADKLMSDEAVEAAAEATYKLVEGSAGAWVPWDSMSRSERHYWIEGARAGHTAALATLPSHPTPDGEEPELERYRDVFGDLCWECGGSGDVPGAFDDDTSGGTKLCGVCNGKGTK